MGEVAALVDLKRRREIACRLTPDRALRSIEEAAAFLSDRGLMTRMQDSSLPSLFAACHEEPSRPGGRGFDLWPKTKWIWSFQLASEQAVVTKLHGGKTLYLSRETALAFDPLVRRAIKSATGDEARLLDHLAVHGESAIDDVALELSWDRRRLKRARDRARASRGRDQRRAGVPRSCDVVLGADAALGPGNPSGSRAAAGG